MSAKTIVIGHPSSPRRRAAILPVFGAGGWVLACATHSFAHHSFAAVFDREQPIVLTGTVDEVEWMNPHTWFYLQVDAAGTRMRWALELGSPNNLLRHGWKRDSLRPGQVVTVSGYRARDGTQTVAVRELTLASGAPLVGGQQQSD
jgi:hypothetical protein